MEPAKKVQHSLDDVIENVLKVKAQFAAKAFQPVDKTIESSRDVFSNACLKIAEAYAERGFKFLKSDPQLVRKRGDWTDRVWLGTSHYNVRGTYVDLTVGALVCNARVKKRRQSRQSPFPFNVEWGTIAGQQLGNLTDDRTCIQWNLADPAERDVVIAEVIDHINRIALPYFEKFESFEKLSRLFLETEIPWLDATEIIDLLICYEGPMEAARYVDWWCESHPDRVPQTAQAIAKMQCRGRPDTPSGWYDQIAAAVLFYDLPVTRLKVT